MSQAIIAAASITEVAAVVWQPIQHFALFDTRNDVLDALLRDLAGVRRGSGRIRGRPHAVDADAHRRDAIVAQNLKAQVPALHRLQKLMRHL